MCFRTELLIVAAGLAFLPRTCIATGPTANGIAPLPPMGFRTWNAYHGDITTSLIKKVVDAVVAKTRKVDGTLKSLADLGYGRVGVDDGWQACGTGHEKSFHALDGTPLVNTSLFPDVKSLVDYGHSHGVKMGWYSVNCICMDTYTVQRDSDANWSSRVYQAEVDFLLNAGFDGVKIDNCGDDQGIGFDMMVNNINKSGKAMLVENSDQGHDQAKRGVPTDNGYCPGNMFRTGGDIVPEFGVVLDKLNRTRPYQDLANPISRPDCWAYPDMLEVGNFKGDAAYTQSRTHFGAWCIVSSPLILGMDVTNDATVDSVWDIISNEEALAVNQVWAGHPGRLIQDSGAYQIWAKKLPAGEQAMLIINKGSHAMDSMDVSLTDIGLATSQEYAVRNIWGKSSLPDAQKTWKSGTIGAYDSAFVRFTPKAVVVV